MKQMKHRTTAKALFIIILGIILWSLAGCTLTKQQRQSNRIVKKIERMKIKHPGAFRDATTETIRIDTFIHEIEIRGEIEVVADSAAIDSLVALLVSAFSSENIPDIPKTVRKAIIKQAPLLINIDSLEIDTLDIKARIWYDKRLRTLGYSFYRDSMHIKKEKKVETVTITKTEVVRRNFFQDWKFYLLIAVVIGGLLLRKNVRPRILR